MKRKIIGIFVCTFLIAIIPLTTGAISISCNRIGRIIPLVCEKISSSDDNIDDIGWYSSLALDEDGYPHISYYDYSNGYLKYAYFDGSSWNVEIVDSDGNVGGYTSIALDSNNYPHISYFDYGNGILKYTYWDGYKWCFEKVTSNNRGKVGMYTSIALDSDDLPHISYCDYGKRTLNYAHFTGSRWDTKVVDNSAQMCAFEYFGDYTSIAIDSKDLPHISYCDFENYDLKYAYFTGSQWKKEVVDSEGYVGQYSSIELDKYDNPHISYGYLQNSVQAFDLKYATKTGDTWNVETVDEPGDVRKWTSLSLDSAGLPHISYYDYWEGALKYAFYDGYTWSFEFVDTNGSTGCFNSLCLDAGNKPCISYYDWGNKALKYASKNQGDWEVQVIEVDTNSDILDQEQNYCCGYATAIPYDQSLAQSFVPEYKTLTRVELMTVKRYNPGSFTVSIRKNLDSEDLTSINLSSDYIAEDMAWKNFDFPDLEVAPSETYYIVCTSEKTENENMYYWYFGIYDSYADGCAWIYNNNWRIFSIGGFPDIDFGFKTFGLNTSIPDKPLTPSGPSEGKINVEYNYTTSTNDPDNDQLYYLFDWGDETYSSWLGPYNSGETVEANHSWSKKSSYNIKVKAKDINGAESSWSDSFLVLIPRTRENQGSFFNLFKSYTYMFPILRRLLNH